MVRGICATDEKMQGKGFNLASKCYFCKLNTDNLDHILLQCNFSQLVWKWLGDVFLFKISESYEDVKSFAKLKSNAVKDIWLLTTSITMMELWFLRNKIFYEDDKIDLGKFKQRIKKYTSDCAIRIKSFMWECNYDMMIFKLFELKHQPIKRQRIVEIKFKLPGMNQTLICCDGASRGNPGAAGYGFICRGDQGEFIHAEARCLGIATNFIAEVMVIIEAVEWAVKNNKLDIVINSDSSAALHAFSTGKFPWFCQVRWDKIKELLWRTQFVHSLREINFSADFLPKKGAGLERGAILIFSTKPNFLATMESPDKIYYRFC
ncbi:uncharacterized protein LOC113291903 [Papaver somniferum]|uniref:uncharacterized protein LOC113291903 n=1 Tax=Papaver somniferum TaxID=3469 RepID=UPI000E705C5B|nr:uncharacterized protein LOC113291903 [Papaver somniferum]